jgi:acyl dehydratase
MAVIGADRLPESPDWRVMITGDVQPVHLDIDVASKLESDLRRIGEGVLAERIGAAVETAKRQMRPKE